MKYTLKQGVKSSVARWYVIRAEQYIKTFPNKRLSNHNGGNGNKYFKELGSVDRIKDW
jgi:hypothetical protein